MQDKKTKIRTISLFSGAGGLDLGLKQAGLDIIWANDNDPDCVETYKKNIGRHITYADISTIDSKSLPDCDLMVGGFPCQGFSMANKFRSPEDKRNKLYVEMLKIINDKKPKWFIAENVPGILSLEKGAIFKAILEDFNDAGYHVVHKLVNMADHGVPQLRKRVMILGTRKDLPERLGLIHPLPTHSKTGVDGLSRWVSINEALSALEKRNKNLPNDDGSKYRLEFRDFSGHRKTDGNKPSPTILARGNAKGGVNATPHPNGRRRLTVRESAQVQTFPLDFEFAGSMTSAYRQIGNAVPVIYGKRLGEQLMMLDKNKRKTIHQRQKKSGSPTVVSLFAGAGGMDLGFEMAGFDLIWANDNDPDTAETYKRNFGVEMVLNDIEKVDIDSIPESDLIIGGFPCQGFSIANMNRSINDQRNRLYKYFVKTVSAKKPKIFVAENVKGILSLAKGQIFKYILKEFGRTGYYCKHALVNAKKLWRSSIKRKGYNCWGSK